MHSPSVFQAFFFKKHEKEMKCHPWNDSINSILFTQKEMISDKDAHLAFSSPPQLCLPARKRIISLASADSPGSSVRGHRRPSGAAAAGTRKSAFVALRLPVAIRLVLWDYFKSDGNLILVRKSRVCCLLTNKQKSPLPSTRIPAWLVLNRWGWPDIYHQLGEERDIVLGS